MPAPHIPERDDGETRDDGGYIAHGSRGDPDSFRCADCGLMSLSYSQRDADDFHAHAATGCPGDGKMIQLTRVHPASERDGETLSDEQKRDASNAALRSMQREYADAVRWAYSQQAPDPGDEAPSDDVITEVLEYLALGKQAREQWYYSAWRETTVQRLTALRAEYTQLTAPKKAYYDDPVMIDGFPRSHRVDHWTPAERAISDAIVAVEAAGADVLLTDAVILLGDAQRKVAEYVDRQIQAKERSSNG